MKKFKFILIISILSLFLLSSFTIQENRSIVEREKVAYNKSDNSKNIFFVDKIIKKIDKKVEKIFPGLVNGGKSQTVALILCFFFGLLGFHRFYLGYPLIGIIQLFTAGGFGIWTFIDFIRIILGDLEPKNGPYDKTF